MLVGLPLASTRRGVVPAAAPGRDKSVESAAVLLRLCGPSSGLRSSLPAAKAQAPLRLRSLPRSEAERRQLGSHSNSEWQQSETGSLARWHAPPLFPNHMPSPRLQSRARSVHVLLQPVLQKAPALPAAARRRRHRSRRRRARAERREPPQPHAAWRAVINHSKPLFQQPLQAVRRALLAPARAAAELRLREAALVLQGVLFGVQRANEQAQAHMCRCRPPAASGMSPWALAHGTARQKRCTPTTPHALGRMRRHATPRPPAPARAPGSYPDSAPQARCARTRRARSSRGRCRRPAPLAF